MSVIVLTKNCDGVGVSFTVRFGGDCDCYDSCVNFSSDADDCVFACSRQHTFLQRPMMVSVSAPRPRTVIDRIIMIRLST